MAGNSYRPPGDIEWLFTLSHDISLPTNRSLTMDCPRCRHWVPDGGNFCQTCGHQFALQIVKARLPRPVRVVLLVLIAMLGIFALIGLFSLLGRQSVQTVAPADSTSNPVTSSPARAAPVCISTTLGLQGRSQNEASSFLIRKDRPSVYIEFERIGKAPPLFEGEKEERVWLKLHNNTRWAVVICSFPATAEYGDIGVVYDVKQSPTPIRTEGRVGGRRTSGKPASKNISQPESSKIPEGYSTGDTCAPYYIDSGKSIVFSVPREHLAKNLYIEFEFWAEWENRDNELGNFPQSFVSFSNQGLPSK